MRCSSFLLALALLSLCQGGIAAGNTTRNVATSKVLIFGLARSGTTLIGSVYDYNPQIFYLFEPLHAANETLVSHSQVLDDVFNCKFEKYHRHPFVNIFWIYARKHMRWFMQTFPRPDFAVFNMTLEDTQQAELVCLKSKIRVVKEIAGSILFNANRSLRLVHVIRDPIRVVNSWFAHKWLLHSNVTKAANEMCNFTVLSLAHPRAPTAYTIFPETSVSAVKLYAYTLLGVPFLQAFRWQARHDSNYDAHSGKKFHGARALKMGSEGIQSVMAAPQCRTVLDFMHKSGAGPPPIVLPATKAPTPGRH